MDSIEERDGSNNVIASYVRDGNVGGVLSRTTPNGKYFYHYDGNGNVVAMTNTSGAIVEYTCDHYGNLTDMKGNTNSQSNDFIFDIDRSQNKVIYTFQREIWSVFLSNPDSSKQ